MTPVGAMTIHVHPAGAKIRCPATGREFTISDTSTVTSADAIHCTERTAAALMAACAPKPAGRAVPGFNRRADNDEA